MSGGGGGANFIINDALREAIAETRRTLMDVLRDATVEMTEAESQMVESRRPGEQMADSVRQAPRTAAVFKMPFGKHKDTPITSVPLDYLKWFITITNRESTWLVVATEIERRTGKRPLLPEWQRVKFGYKPSAPGPPQPPPGPGQTGTIRERDHLQERERQGPVRKFRAIKEEETE